MAEYDFVCDRVQRIAERMAQAAHRAGRPAGSTRLMAVSKFHPAAAVEAAYAAGMRLFGESRVQEALSKFDPALRAKLPGASLHMIGTLQSNKINKALAGFECIQSISSSVLLEAVAARVLKTGREFPVLLELHTGEESKSGFPDTDALLKAVEEELERVQSGFYRDAGSGRLRLAGLMTMAPYTDKVSELRRSFRTLAAAAEAVRTRFGLAQFTELSMGMSGDYEIAIEEGSTLVRVGTAVFGERR